VPSRDDQHLFEMLILEGAQAGLSWETILNRREGYRRAFANFDPKKIVRFDAAKVKRLLADPGIIRNRLKIESTISNARAFLDVQKEFGSFSAWLWERAGGKPIRERRRTMRDIPAETPLARELSRELKKRGFRFVGPTIVYAYLQAVGVVNDHVEDCFRYEELSGKKRG
jgi:DNA-3-methyladenine glycosylase I